MCRNISLYQYNESQLQYCDTYRTAIFLPIQSPNWETYTFVNCQIFGHNIYTTAFPLKTQISEQA